MNKSSQWPKNPIPLTEEQLRYKQEFLKVWHEILPKRYGFVERFNHQNKIISTLGVNPGIKTLEIGAGLGEHIYYEDTSLQEYTALEVRADFVDIIKGRFPNVKVLSEDIEKKTSLPSAYFDRIIAIHVLEHLRNLPAALSEVKRLLKPTGFFSVVIPCEGGLAYEIGRTLSARRIFESRYKTSYTPIIKNEHVNQAWEILQELEDKFKIEEKIFWPFPIPVIQPNLVIAMALSSR